MDKINDIVEDGNRLIAKFMDIEILDNQTDLEAVSKISYKRMLPAQLQYHTSWDWLMPVVEKIEGFEYAETGIKIYSIQIINTTCLIYSRNYDNRGIGGLTKIEAVWLAVVEFIKWCNQKQ